MDGVISRSKGRWMISWLKERHGALQHDQGHDLGNLITVRKMWLWCLRCITCVTVWTWQHIQHIGVVKMSSDSYFVFYFPTHLLYFNAKTSINVSSCDSFGCHLAAKTTQTCYCTSGPLADSWWIENASFDLETVGRVKADRKLDTKSKCSRVDNQRSSLSYRPTKPDYCGARLLQQQVKMDTAEEGSQRWNLIALIASINWSSSSPRQCLHRAALSYSNARCQ